MKLGERTRDGYTIATHQHEAFAEVRDHSAPCGHGYYRRCHHYWKLIVNNQRYELACTGGAPHGT